MNFSLVTAYPFWMVILCLMVGVGYSAILYYKNRNNGFATPVIVTLFIIRTLAVSLISFLLLSPLLKTVIRHTEKPVVLVALDNSESIVVSKDSSQYREAFLKELRDFSSSLGKNYDVVAYSFDDKVQPGLLGTYNGKETDFSGLFSEIKNRYTNRNLAALVLATDGIVTRGTDPLYTAENVPYSIYTVAMGDTTQHKDLLLAKVNYNQVAYLGNNFPMEITLLGHLCEGAQSRLTISSGDKQLFDQEVSITSKEYTKTFPVILSASVPGIQRFRISVTPVKGEISQSNNYKDIFLEVLDGRQKILILSASPHPDIAALKSAIETNKNYEVHDYLIGDFNGNCKDYNLVILNQLPSLSDAAVQVLTQLKDNSVPVLYILGSQSNLPAFNANQAGLNIPPSNISSTSAYPVLNRNFDQFSISNEIAEILPDYPPLSVPFGQYKSATTSDVLLYQKIGSVVTPIPLIVFNQSLEKKSAVIAGEGLWRWRLTNYLKLGNHRAFDEFIGKMVQFLALKADKSQFRVLNKNYFNENEVVEFDAELYNDSFELINDPDVNISISNQEGKSFPFTFSRTPNAYYLNAGSFPPGEYTWKATTSYGGKNYQKTGSFVVMMINEETMNTVADFKMLFNLSKQHGGEMYHPGQLQKLAKQLSEREDIKSVSYSQKKFTDLVNLFWVFLIILALFSTEWLIRKRSGGY